MLRQDSEPQGDLTPVPGLADLDSLLAEVSKAGLGVRLRVEGTRRSCPPGWTCRPTEIVQEALTNVVKHAGPARAQVTVGYRDQEVTLEVTDDGRGVGALAGDGRAGVGHGLIGMRSGWRRSMATWTPALDRAGASGCGGSAAAGGGAAMSIRVVVADDCGPGPGGISAAGRFGLGPGGRG